MGDLQRSVTPFGDRIGALGSKDFTFEESEDDDEDKSEQDVEFRIGGDLVNGSHDGVVAANLRKEAQLLLSSGDLQGNIAALCQTFLAASS
ncbi:unnamed protein product [Rhodiola kirilowii]